MTDLSQQRIQALGQQLTSIEDDVADLAKRHAILTAKLDGVLMYAELASRIDDLAACVLDGTEPEVTAGVQARLVRHAQEKP